MLPKVRKLRGPGIFSEIFKGSRRFSGRYHNSYIATTSGQSKFACVVSLKVSKKAVERNKIRRRGFAVIARLLSQIKDGYLVVLVFTPLAAKADFKEIDSDIVEVFKKAHLLN